MLKTPIDIISIAGHMLMSLLNWRFIEETKEWITTAGCGRWRWEGCGFPFFFPPTNSFWMRC
jgi:hypothetical protein